MIQRTYRGRQRHLGGALSAAAAALLLLPASAASLFSGQPLDQRRFAVLAKPVGNSDWMLLVLEQITPQPLCWEQRPDGLIDPALNRFDFAGICSRYLDSNGYSLRIGAQDLASRYRLRLEQRGTSLVLLAMTPSDPTQLLVGRGAVPQRDRDGFVRIQLEPGWQLQRRAFGAQTLNHVYFAHATPLAQLLRAAGGSNTSSNSTSSRIASGTGAPRSSGPIALQVVPFSP